MNYKQEAPGPGAKVQPNLLTICVFFGTSKTTLLLPEERWNRSESQTKYASRNDFIITSRRKPKYCAFISIWPALGAIYTSQGPAKASTQTFLCANGYRESSFESVGARVDEGHYFFYNFSRKWIGKGNTMPGLKTETNNLRAHKWRVSEAFGAKAKAKATRLSGDPRSK